MGKKKKKRGRGSKTHGHGSKKKHRGAGSRGGRGKAGTMKHHKIKVQKEDPAHIGKKGFSRPESVKEEKTTINVGELERFDEEEIDLEEMGYDKLLAKGNVARSLDVIVPECTTRALSKIEEAGGTVTTEEGG